MAKKEPKNKIKSYEKYLNEISTKIYPCERCKTYKENNNHQVVILYNRNGFAELGDCAQCCWNWKSNFKDARTEKKDEEEWIVFRCLLKNGNTGIGSEPRWKYEDDMKQPTNSATNYEVIFKGDKKICERIEEREKLFLGMKNYYD